MGSLEKNQNKPAQVFDCPFESAKLESSKKKSKPASVCDSAVPKKKRARLLSYLKSIPLMEKRKTLYRTGCTQALSDRVGVNENLEVVLPGRRVELSNLVNWIRKVLTEQDEVVPEMTTNTWQLYDELSAYVRP